MIVPKAHSWIDLISNPLKSFEAPCDFLSSIIKNKHAKT